MYSFSEWSINEAKYIEAKTKYDVNIITFNFYRDHVDVWRKYLKSAKLKWFSLDSQSRISNILHGTSQEYVVNRFMEMMKYQLDRSNKPPRFAEDKPGTYEAAVLANWEMEHNLPEIIESNPILKKWYDLHSKSARYGI